MTFKFSLITGANRGLGFEIAKQILNSGPNTAVILTGRRQRAIEEAANALLASSSSIRDGSGSSSSQRVFCFEMDVRSPDQIEWVHQQVNNTVTDRLDVLVNNAAIMVKDQSCVDENCIRDTIDTNFFGAFHCSRIFGGYTRVVNMGARVCQLDKNPYLKAIPEINNEIRSVLVEKDLGQIRMQLSDLETLVDTITEKLVDGTYTTPELLKKIPKAFPNSSYLVSKIALHALTRILAAQRQTEHSLINACCPRWVKTSMGGPNAPLTVEQGAETAVWLATAPQQEIAKNGELFGEKKVLGFL